MPPKPVVLIVLDGWGINPRREQNAIALARTPTWDSIFNVFPTTQLDTSGYAVGLPKGVMGNSEAGHLNIGAGRVVWQENARIDRAIEDGSFFQRPVLRALARHIQETGGALHLMGLVSDGCVHSVDRHYFALLEWAKRSGVAADKLFFHAFLDGRDTPPTSGLGYLRALEGKMGEIGVGRIATVMGRYWAMDRDRRWERTEQAYDAILLGQGVRTARNAAQAGEEAYRLGETDEFVKPTVIVDGSNAPLGRVQTGDAVLFFNFRADRARQLTRAMTEEKFSDFLRKAFPKVHFATMTQYHEDFTLPVVFEPIQLKNILGEVLSAHKLKQLRIAETEKYAHVTFFFNGGSDTAFPGEERFLVPSPKVSTYDLKPEMSAFEVTDRVVEAIRSDRFDVIVLNYANPDMVGHSGKLNATIRAVEAVDNCLARVLEAVRAKKGIVLITSDHGNCEQMWDERSNQPHTYHTTNPVPFVLVGDEWTGALLRSGGSPKDIAPTILELLNVQPPSEMEGQSLLKR